MPNKFAPGTTVRKIDKTRTGGTILEVGCRQATKAGGNTCNFPCIDPNHTLDHYRVDWQSKITILSENELELETLTFSNLDQLIDDKDLEAAKVDKKIFEKTLSEKDTFKDPKFDKKFFDEYNNKLPTTSGGIPVVKGWSTPEQRTKTLI